MADNQRQFIPLNIAVLVVSDTRTEIDDKSGKVLVEKLSQAGHQLAAKTIVKDDIYQIRACVSQWIADVLESKYDKKDVVVVGNGVDLQQFYAPVRKKNKQFTVGVMYADELSFKGCDTSINSVLKARESIPNIKLVAFAMRPPVESLPLPDNSEFYLKPEQEDIKTIYSQCDAWLFGSRSEGFGLPLLEAMACRTPVIATKTGAAPELLDDAAGYLIDIDDVTAMANAIIDISKMTPVQWIELSDKAFDVATQHPWKNKVIEFENALIQIYND